MTIDLVDILRNRVNLKNHPFFKDLSPSEIVGYKKACIDIAMELDHAIKYDEITFQIKVNALKIQVNKANEGKRGRPSIYEVE